MIPKVIGGGEFIMNSNQPSVNEKETDKCTKLHSFIVMDYTGDTMHRLIIDENISITRKSVCKVISRLIHHLQHIHTLGFVYNNLSLKNILIGDFKNPRIEDIKLMDFTKCTRY